MIRWGVWVSFLNPTYHYSNPISLTSQLRAWSAQDLLLSGINHVSLPDELNYFGKFSDNLAIRQDRVFEVGTSEISTNSAAQVGPLQIGLLQNGTSKIDISEISSNELTSGKISSSKISSYEIGIIKPSTIEKSISNIGIDQISSSQISIPQFNVSHDGGGQKSVLKLNPFTFSIGQVSSTQVNHLQLSSFQYGSFQVGVAQIDSQNQGTQILSPQVAPFKIETKSTLSSSIALQQFLSSHNTSATSIYDINNTALTLWDTYLQPSTSLNLTIEIVDLPTGQLAEAQITQFSPNGTPTGGTLYLDYNANGLGWYIDPTPWDNSEYSQTLTDTAYRATPDSLAYGHYDLLTTILHETAHLQGFISGYSNYDRHIQSINGSKTFVGDGFSAILTPDGSHLNSQVYPYDLMNTTLTPGVRKLPSALDIAILNTLRQPTSLTAQPALLTAPLSAGALIAINNGSYSLRERFANDTNTDWYTRGDSQILNGQAIFSEGSPYLSHQSQTFVIPQGAKALQFTLVNADLHSSLAPNPSPFSQNGRGVGGEGHICEGGLIFL